MNEAHDIVLALLCVFVGLAAPAAAEPFGPDKPNAIDVSGVEAKFVRLAILTSSGHPCIDELEIYAAGSNDNLALASGGAKATASSLLEGHAIHQVANLNDGKYGNSHSWIAAGAENEWAQIELPKAARIGRVVWSRDRDGTFRDRMPQGLEVQVSADGKEWKTVARAGDATRTATPKPAREAKARRPDAPKAASDAVPPPPADASHADLVRHAFAAEAASFARVDRTAPLDRVLKQADDMLDRLAARGLDVSAERAQFAALRQRAAALAVATGLDASAGRQLFHDARMAKRRLMLRDPDLAPLGKLLLVKRHPYTPSHNYSDIMDSRFRAGGGICTLDIPCRNGRLDPADAKLTMLFDGAAGIARDPVLDFDARTIYFAWRPMDANAPSYWHIHRMDANGANVRPLTDGPYHDYYPCPLPDGGLAFVSTRCRSRYLCWVPMAMVLFRMDANGANARPLSHANVSEWGPSVMRDGRIIWTRSEYLDKGADYGHTLWAIRPDGTAPELIYGNNSGLNLMNGREVPGSEEVCATQISHFGDFNGPIALVDVNKGRFARDSATVITPDNTATSNAGVFRDPVPISRDHVLISHKAGTQFGLYVIDRWGNRELLYVDPAIGSMAPTPFRAQPRPPVLSAGQEAPANETRPGRLIVMDVYDGLGPDVQRGTVKYIRVCQELKSDLEALPDGRLRETYRDFHRFYASPVDQISGPVGWPGYVAKGVVGLAPVEADGSAQFEVPAGKVLYLEALDADLNEVQRMRSVLQVQPGESRSCNGCHDSRSSAGVPRSAAALRRPASKLQPPPWGAGPFAYERVVQPVLDARCVRCHDGRDANRTDLRGLHDRNKIPASYTALIKGGWVHYFNMNWHLGHTKAEPLTFGTVKSKLFPALAGKGHEDVKLSPAELHAIKCWIDLNCPLWGDYKHVSQRPT